MSIDAIHGHYKYYNQNIDRAHTVRDVHREFSPHHYSDLDMYQHYGLLLTRQKAIDRGVDGRIAAYWHMPIKKIRVFQSDSFTQHQCVLARFGGKKKPTLLDAELEKTKTLRCVELALLGILDVLHCSVGTLGFVTRFASVA